MLGAILSGIVPFVDDDLTSFLLLCYHLTYNSRTDSKKFQFFGRFDI
jgi:hypothetical protein